MKDYWLSQALQEGAAGGCWLLLPKENPELLFSLPTKGLCSCRSCPCTGKIPFQDFPFSFTLSYEAAAPFTQHAKD